MNKRLVKISGPFVEKEQRVLRGMGMISQLTDIAHRLHELGEDKITEKILESRNMLAARVENWSSED